MKRSRELKVGDVISFWAFSKYYGFGEYMVNKHATVTHTTSTTLRVTADGQRNLFYKSELRALYRSPPTEAPACVFLRNPKAYREL
jgi:hypothetical protein